jgi:gas vesicle protein
MRYPSIPTIPGVFIESSFRGHKAIPGNYTITLKAGPQTNSTTATILANPLYQVGENDYKEFDALMKQMEGEVITMHSMILDLYESKNQLEGVLKNLPSEEKYSAVKAKGDAVVQLLKAWDEDMIQRKSTAYDDVENFPNKFTAEYMFMVNQNESDIPRVNQPVLDLLKEYTPKWEALKARGLDLKNNILPALNKQLWEAGVGAVWIK